MSEYVKIKASEMSYGEENLLQSQVNLINLLKQYQEYESLRKEEIFLKIDLKKKIGEAGESLDRLGKLLPESKLLEEQKKREEMQREIIEKIEGAVQKSKKKEDRYSKENSEDKGTNAEKEEKEPKSSLDQELEEIRKKLERLQ